MEHSEPHRFAQLTVLLDLQAGVSVAAQDYCVVALGLTLHWCRGRPHLRGHVLPTPTARRWLQYHCGVVVACTRPVSIRF